MTTRNRFTATLVATLLLVVLAGCSGGSPTGPSTKPSTPPIQPSPSVPVLKITGPAKATQSISQMDYPLALVSVSVTVSGGEADPVCFLNGKSVDAMGKAVQCGVPMHVAVGRNEVCAQDRTNSLVLSACWVFPVEALDGTPWFALGDPGEESKEVVRSIIRYTVGKTVRWADGVVGVWFQDTTLSQARKQQVLDTWADKLGNVRFVFSDSAAASVHYVWVPQASFHDPAVCADANLKWDGLTNAIQSGFVRVSTRDGCSVNSILAHELGHVVGHYDHSPPNRDLMSPRPLTIFSPGLAGGMKFIYNHPPGVKPLDPAGFIRAASIFQRPTVTNITIIVD